jgi:pimeloyl-[acyl-carrier protein] synthase
VAVIAAVLGIPRADSARVLRWAAVLRGILDSGIAEGDTESVDSVTAMQDYFLSLVRDPTWRKTEAGAAFASLWEAYPAEVAAANLAMLAFAGHETTVHLLGSLAMHLGARPALWTSAGADPATATAAVAEVLRLESPIQKICRWASSDVSIGGVLVPAGGLIVLLVGSANRDPNRFPRADEFDIHRPGDQIAFGGGRHLCLGKSLALLEATTLLEVLPKRWPEIAVRDTVFQWLNNASFRGLRKLTLRRQAD